MKIKIIGISIVLLASLSLLKAQDDGYYEGEYSEENRETINYTTSLGAQLLWGGGLSWSQSYPGYQSKLSFNNLPDITATGYLPISSQNKLGVLGEVGIFSTSYASAPESNTSYQTTTQIKYFIVGASFFYSGAYAGLNYGFALAGSMHTGDQPSADLSAEVFDSYIGLKLGYNYPIWESPSNGRVNFVAQMDFTMKGLLFNDKTYPDPKPSDPLNERRFNYQPLQLKVGINYFFNISGFASY